MLQVSARFKQEGCALNDKTKVMFYAQNIMGCVWSCVIQPPTAACIASMALPLIYSEIRYMETEHIPLLEA